MESYRSDGNIRQSRFQDKSKFQAERGASHSDKEFHSSRQHINLNLIFAWNDRASKQKTEVI